MIRLLIPFLATALAAGCAGRTSTPVRVDPNAFSHVYTCAAGDRFALRQQPPGDEAVLTLDGRHHRLSRVRAASGTAYAGEGLRFHGKAGEARVTTADGELTGCRARPADSPWHQAALLGIDFRGLGQEPGWILDIDRERWIHLRADYGEREVFMPVTEPIRHDGRTVYRTRTTEHRLEAVIREQPCRDVMSGHAFSHSVTVTLDGERWNGCGRWLD
ncbi:MliC family protein [Ectothiorhodospiraceae bacterium WFHF3C12]|nr:MliC family protein [Ectothiorhodospiraceae bacterium WFHF3C12]